MKLDPDLIQYMTKEQFRVLTAIEMGMKNHQYVPVPLIEALAALKRSNTFKVIQLLLKHKLIMHYNKAFDGYALTYMGYDYLALKAFMKRGTITRVGIKIGVGKESDIYLCEGGIKEEVKGDLDEQEEQVKGDRFKNPVVVKFARLGRTSFRTVKNNRDYLNGRAAQSWLYLSRIASLKEFAFMKALYNKDFPTPVPIDSNRHGIVMSFIDAYPMSQVREMENPKQVYCELLDIVIRLAEYGLVHGDFNEFNLLLDVDEKITIIDFPQMTSTNHPQAQFYFERDVKCLQDYFMRKFGLKFEGIPLLESDIQKKEDLDKQIRASGFVKEELGEDLQAFDNIHEHLMNKDEDDKQDDEEEDQVIDNNDEVPAVIADEQKKAVSFKDQNDIIKDKDEQNEINSDDEDEDSNEEDEDNKKEDRKAKKEKPVKVAKKKEPKLVINEDYVKEKAKKQFKNTFNKEKTKRNRNKDKKVMKDNEVIKDYFLD